jgi:hypothetical protein
MAVLPGVVGPDKGNVPSAKLDEAAPDISATIVINFPTAILTITSIQHLMVCVFKNFAAIDKHKIAAQRARRVALPRAGDHEGRA